MIQAKPLYMTWANIQHTHPNTWVFLGNPKYGKKQRLLGRYVLKSALTRAELVNRESFKASEQYPFIQFKKVVFTGELKSEADFWML